MSVQTIQPVASFVAGPYSPGVIAEGKFLFISGQGPYCSQSHRFIRGTVAEQTRLTLKNLQAVLSEAGLTASQVVTCKVYLQQLTESSFQQMNEAYADFFGSHKPARTTVGCQLLNIDVEVDAIAAL